MPAGQGWTGAQYSTPPSGQSIGSYFSVSGNMSGAGGNTNSQSPAIAAGAPAGGGLFGMSSTMQQVVVFGVIVLFLASWHAHAYSLME